MTDLEIEIAALESKAADCDLMGSLSADPEVRAECRRRSTDLKREARALQDFGRQRRTA